MIKGIRFRAISMSFRRNTVNPSPPDVPGTMTAHPRIVPASYHQRTIRCNTNIHRTKPLVVLSIQENKPFRSETRTFRNEKISKYDIFSGYSLVKLPQKTSRKQKMGRAKQ